MVPRNSGVLKTREHHVEGRGAFAAAVALTAGRWRNIFTICAMRGGAEGVNPFRTAVPFWGQTSQISSSLSPKRDWGSKGVKERRGVCAHSVHGRSRMIVDPCTPAMPGRSTSGFHRPGRQLLAPSANHPEAREGVVFGPFCENWSREGDFVAL